MFCENCGNQMPEGSKFCINCGAKIAAPETPDTAQAESAVTVDVAEAEAASGGSAPASEQQPAPQPAPVAQPAPQPAPAQPTPQPAPVVQPAPQPAPAAQPVSQPQFQQPVTQPVAPPVARKPEKIEPLPVWKFIGMFILTVIPIIGFIMILVWSFAGSFNRNTRNYARACSYSISLYLASLIIINLAASEKPLNSSVPILKSGKHHDWVLHGCAGKQDRPKPKNCST